MYVGWIMVEILQGMALLWLRPKLDRSRYAEYIRTILCMIICVAISLVTRDPYAFIASCVIFGTCMGLSYSRINLVAVIITVPLMLVLNKVPATYTSRLNIFLDLLLITVMIVDRYCCRRKRKSK